MFGKPAASLSSGLLARKGHARPAMRPQGYMNMGPGSSEDLGWNDMGEDVPRPQPYPAPVESPLADVPTPPVLRQLADLEEQIAQPPQIEMGRLSWETSTDDESYFGEEYDETAEYESDDETPASFAPLGFSPAAYAPEPEPEFEEEFEAEPAPVPMPIPAKPRAVTPVAAPVPKATAARVAREVKGGKAKAAFTLRLDNERHLKLRLASALCNRSAQQLVTEALDAFLESIAEVDELARQVAAREVRQPGV